MDTQKTIKTLLIGGFVSLWVFIIGFVVTKTDILKKPSVLPSYKTPVLAYETKTMEAHKGNAKKSNSTPINIEELASSQVVENTKDVVDTSHNESVRVQEENTQNTTRENQEKPLAALNKPKRQETPKQTPNQNEIAIQHTQENNFSPQQQEGENITQQETHEQNNQHLCGDFPCFSGEEFVQLYNSFEAHNPKLQSFKKYIYNNKEADDHIRHIAELRGYRQRKFANPSELVPFAGRQTRPELRDAYINMRDAMKKDGAILHFVSAYRSSSHQRRIFQRKMGAVDVSKIPSGIYDKKIDTVLKVSSIPGYSKHHSGYAVDFGCGNDYLVYSFNTTNCYQWLSKNNFENAKRFGFIPSYPDGAEKQGPDPEPWEFVWVGVDTIKAGL